MWLQVLANEKERLKVLQSMVAHSQYTASGDNTLSAMRFVGRMYVCIYVCMYNLCMGLVRVVLYVCTVCMYVCMYLQYSMYLATKFWRLCIVCTTALNKTVSICMYVCKYCLTSFISLFNCMHEL